MAGYSFAAMVRFLRSNKRSTTRRPLRNVRDALVRSGSNVLYYVWGNRIATLIPKKRVLVLTSAGWETDLTKNRLNQILPKGYISQRKFMWYYNINGKSIKWSGTIRLKV